MHLISKLAIAFATCTALLAPQAKADVVSQEDAESLLNKKTPVRVWHDPAQKPRAVAIAIHGLVMHGGVYDSLAKNLASQGFVVYAPDLRGFGRWHDIRGKEAALNYNKSSEDINEIVQAARKKYPDIPLYCIGESMGAGFAMKAAVDNPNTIDGLVLSAPALKPRFFVGPILKEAPKVAVAPRKKVNLAPYIKRFASNDPAIIEESLKDPLVTKQMTTWEIANSIRTMRPNLGYARKLPSNLPMLVIQGDNDRMLRANAVVQMVAKTKTKDQTVRWFSNRGHLLLETAYLQQDTLNTVNNWLHQHMSAQQFEFSDNNYKQILTSDATSPQDRQILISNLE
ncbi:MAG TPA: alpha/beta fold hydrolase [Drouetiella sp.]